MKYTVKLTVDDQRIMLEALIASQEIKEKKLQKPDSIATMRRQYLDAAEKFLEPIEIHDKKKNIFVWFIDQMQHSGRFWNTELCMRACAIADRAIENEYDHYKSVQIYEDLFEVK